MSTSQLIFISSIARIFAVLAGMQAQQGTASPKQPTSVKLFFVEALDPKDTVYSQRFQKEYEFVIKRGTELTASSLAACGFRLETTTSFFGASDPLQAKEQAERAKMQGAWMIVGPHRSNHYILLSKGAEDIPSVSPMASSDEVAALGKLHLSLSPSNAILAKSAAEESAERLTKQSKKDYMTVTASDCMTCKDFSRGFDAAASDLGLKKIAELSVLGQQPDLKQIKEEVSKHRPAFVLIPNYSILSSYLIASLNQASPSTFFVGGDGWGNSKFGFVQNGRDTGAAGGFAVRGSPSIEEALKSFGLGKTILKADEASSYGSASGVALLKIFDSLSRFLCASKPKAKDNFAKAFQNKGNGFFSSQWGVSIFDLTNGDIVYTKSKKVH